MTNEPELHDNERALFGGPGFANPPYVTMEGVVTWHAELPTEDDDEFCVHVQTTKGRYRGYANGRHRRSIRIGGYARIELYDWGGGHYPDNRICSSGTMFPCQLK